MKYFSTQNVGTRNCRNVSVSLLQINDDCVITFTFSFVISIVTLDDAGWFKVKILEKGGEGMGGGQVKEDILCLSAARELWIWIHHWSF
jgi:hypothetical protein